MKCWQMVVAFSRRLSQCNNTKIVILSFVFIILSFTAVSGKGFSQPVSINTDNTEIRQIIKNIEQQSDYRFFYTDGLTDLNRKVSIHITSQSIDSVMSVLLSGTQLGFQISNDNRVILAPKETMQQAFVVTGIVSDKDGPMPGANVVVKGTSVGTVTDVNGKYSITVPGKDAKLTFSFLGYLPQDVVAGNQKIVNVTMSENLNQIDEVVVIGYGTEKKLTSTGAVSSISTSDLLRSPVPNIGNMLVGQVTGLSSIQTTALPGADDPQIFVRGIGTLNAANASPLILVDGVQRNFFQLDPNEIESISILKDASATAVFGVQGANGVIIVTTKRGSEGPPKITVSLSAGMQTPLRVLDMVDSYDYCIAYNEYKQSDFFPDAMMEKYKTGADPLLYPSHNWVKELIKPYAFQTQDNINISGGTATVKYFASLGYLNQDGLFKQFRGDIKQNYTYARYNYRTNFDIQATKSTKFSVSLSGITGVRTQPNNTETSVSNYDVAAFNQARWALPFISAGINDGKLVTANTKYIDPNGVLPLSFDPFQYWYGKGMRNLTSNEMNVDLAFEQTLDAILKGLSASVKYSYNNSYTHNKIRTYNVPIYTPWRISDTENWQNVDPTADPNEVVLVPSGEEAQSWGYSESYTKRSRKYYWEGALRYNQKFGNHQVGGLFLGNMKKTYYVTDNNNPYPNVPFGSLGFVWRGTYNYKQKYLLDLNAGYNGSENFAPGKRFGFFPAASIGWVVSEEKFMRKIPLISFLKFRVSMGKVGSDNVGADRFLYLLGSWAPSDGVYYFGNTKTPVASNGAHEKTAGNPDVTWETALKQNVGLDLGLLAGRLNINADLFSEKRRDILWTRSTVPEYIAIDLPHANIGKVDNKGYEISFKWNDRLGNNRKNTYWVGGNVSYSRNKIIYMDEIKYDYPWMQKTGQRVGQNLGYIFQGLYTASDFPEASKYADFLAPGDAKYKDLNGDGAIDINDQCPIGYSKYPDYIFGFNAGFRYNGFDFSMLWQAATHVSKELTGWYRLPFNTGAYNLLQYTYDERYVSETLTPNATYPRLSGNARAWNYDFPGTSSLFVRDASYLRLKNVEIGYNISAAVLKKLGITNLRVYLNGSNLLTFDKLLFMDPEESGGTTEYPNMATTNFGITFNF